ncbi:MAG: 8-oxo-dGTP diphosphatase [Candidatus Sumerlaeota bacterium]|nr:8-oxo-dGTP diphosphatase [Candidatus Sumerlaeota bacterium]
MSSGGPRHKVVVAAIIEHAGRILVCQRRVGDWGAGKWEFPGGKLEVGENPRLALERECEEELGVIARAGAVYDVVHHTYADLGPVLLLFIKVEIVSGEPSPVEVAAFDWSRPEDLAKYDWLPADEPIVARLMAEGV